MTVETQHTAAPDDVRPTRAANPLYDPQPDAERPARPGPVPDPDVFTGWVGQTVRDLDPTTEADPVAILVNLLSAGGAIIGPGPFLWIGNDRHPALIWALTVGATAAGRKGAASNTVKRLFKAADPQFVANHMPSGLSSGEGLIEAVRDGDPDPKPGKAAKGGEGVVDKRLWVVESEYGITMARARREGSSLGGVLRQAWNGEDLGVMNREAMRSTAPHIALIGHISPRELRAKMQDSELAGGTYNRFLPVFVHRNLSLPDATGAPEHLVNTLANTWRTVLTDARQVGEVKLTDAAGQLWREEVYPALSGADDDDGPLAEFTARAAPYAKRAAMVYALLDNSDRIQEQHLRASWALIRYARASAAHILGPAAGGTGDPNLDKLAAAVKTAAPGGLTQSEVQVMFKRQNATQRGELTARLCQLPGFAAAQVPNGGRHTTVYLYAPPD
ncbi:hypothetical protein GCM10018781_10380 [Kitasatospora indigofera]|uniref:DUF3987 domain-containing protein n=1 Tax=Kitasatospora indigofera TaxID=67307 RepID=A0A919KKG6_9ACTN|nr:DUF3987 domain-containing protein [Kitasatospora indigofera]GHH62339.1 hypothetical protein GCM10018781_10380 [Kitasatospora indigofera]